MARFANIPQTVKAVFPMNQKFIRGTGINPEVQTKLEAIAQGLKTTTTNASKQDVYAMNRLSPGDDIAFYNSEGDVSFAKYQSNSSVPQEIFYPNSSGARRQYAVGEGGNPKYTNVTLFGGFKPEVIPLDQPFSRGAGYKPALSANSQVMHFSDATPIVNFASHLPENSSLPGTIDRLPSQIANKVRQRKQYDEQYADTGFYKDSYVNWRQSPIPNQQGASPYFKDHLASAEYSPELMAASGYVLDDNGKYQKVMWENKGKNGGVVGEIYIDGERQPIVGNPGNIENYKPVYLNKNYVGYAFNNPEKYGITAPRSQYKNLGVSGTDNKGNPLYKFQRRDIPFENTLIKSSRMQNADQELYDVNQLIKQGRIGDVKEVYYGSFGELGYDAIQQLGRSGGSGRWVDDTNPEDYNLFKLNGSSSQANQMNRNDLLENGGYSPDWAGGIAFNERGMPVDIPGHQVPPGYQNLSPGSEVVELAPQYRFNQPRNISRLTEESELPPLTQLNPYFVNDYGVIQKSYITNKAPLSVQRHNGTLDNSQMANQGRWVGGGIMDEGRGRHALSSDPLDSDLEIRLPQGIAYKPELERSDPRLKKAWNRQQQALQQAALTSEEKFIPHQKDYDIEYSTNQIPGDILNQAIEGAYLPALVENQQGNFEPTYHPYIPNSSLLDQHLADVKIKLGNQYYPLTREATTLQYLPSEKQASLANQQMYAKRKIYNDDRIEEFEDAVIPDDAIVSSAKNNSVYANPDIDGSLDIVGALDRERQQIQALNTIAEQKLPYNISQGQGINLVDDYGSGKMDMQLLAANPMMAMHQMVNIVPKENYQLNTLRDSVLYGKSQGQPTLLGMSQTQRVQSNKFGATIGKSTSLNRIINEEEAARIQQQMTVRPRVQKEIITDDGTTYWEDVDGQGVYQKDLESIIENPNKKLSYDEVLLLLDQKTADYQTAKNAYTQLMNLEPQDEIIINATAKKPRKLSDQLQQYGLASEVTDNDVYARGSLTAGLPGENIPNLPVQRFKQVEVDPEIVEMASFGKATNQIVDIGNEYRNQLAQDRRMEQIGYPAQHTQYLEPEEIQNKIIANAARNAMLDRKADYAGDALASMLTQVPEYNNNLAQKMLKAPFNNKPSSMNALSDIVMLTPQQLLPVNSKSSPMLRGSIIDSPWNDPTEIELFNTMQGFNQAKSQAPLMLTSPKNPNDYTPEQLLGLPPLANAYAPTEISQNVSTNNFPTEEPQISVQRNPWLRPGLVGAGLIGGTGLSLYYQQQRKQQQEDERKMRGYRI